MLTLHDISYTHPNRDILFQHLNLVVNRHEKVALIGNNGTGKSSLLRIIVGQLQPASGRVTIDGSVGYIPQAFGQFNHLSVAQAMGVDAKLTALHEILAGNMTGQHLATLDDDWTIEERCAEALRHWQLEGVDQRQPLSSLSGGQKTRVLLAGLSVHQPDVVLLDEPSNHLDTSGRKLLYDFVDTTTATLLLVSHDRALLNLVGTTCELSRQGLTVYGGNYEFYAGQRQAQLQALEESIKGREKNLKQAREKERETLERQQKLDARGKKKQEKAGVARIMMNTMRNNAENSTSRLRDVHKEKINRLTGELHDMRAALPDLGKMRFGFDNSGLHYGKVLFAANGLNYSYGSQLLWPEALSLQIRSGERLAIGGTNGSGKTTLLKIILGRLTATHGEVEHTPCRSVYIDQDYSLIDNGLAVSEQAAKFNTSALLEHEIKIRLNRFLFGKEAWDKPCAALSGGERMRLMLCCLTIGEHAPDMIVLDEPTNNLDIQSTEILTAAINEYEGTLIVVSHDEQLLKDVRVEKTFVPGAIRR